MQGPQPAPTPGQQLPAAAAAPGQTVTTGLPPTAPAHAFDDMEEPVEQTPATLDVTPPSIMAQSAMAGAVLPPLSAALPPPTITQLIVGDHSQTLTLFSHFFQAAAVGDALHQDMLASALAVDMRLHSQAENAVLYPVLQSRLGASGAQWAARALAEHSLIEQSVADILALRAAGGGDALINRMKQLQSEFTAHQMEEESQILPAVAAALTPEEAMGLATQFKAAKQGASLVPSAQSVMAQAITAAGQAQAMAAEAAAFTSGVPPAAQPAQQAELDAAAPASRAAVVATGMDVGAGTVSPQGGEVDMGAELAPAGSKAAEAGVAAKPAGMMEAEA